MNWRNSSTNGGGRDSRQPRVRWLPLAAATACMLLTNSGCGITSPREWMQNGFKVGPNYCPPAAPVAEAWIHGRRRRTSKTATCETGGACFKTRSSIRLIETAYARNLTLQVLGARVLEARDATGDRRRVALSAGATDDRPIQPRQPSATTRSTIRRRSQFLSPVPLPPGTDRQLLFPDWSTGFNMSWELDFWGRFRRNIESADARLDASVENYDDGLVTLLADVATNYVQYRVAQQRIKIRRDNVRIQEGVLTLAEERFKVGTATELDVKQAQTVLEATRATHSRFAIVHGAGQRPALHPAGHAAARSGGGVGPGAGVGQQSRCRTRPTWVAAGIPADLLRRRPDVRSAERQVAAQTAQIGVAEADLYPGDLHQRHAGLRSRPISPSSSSRRASWVRSRPAFAGTS